MAIKDGYARPATGIFHNLNAIVRNKSMNYTQVDDSARTTSPSILAYHAAP